MKIFLFCIAAVLVISDVVFGDAPVAEDLSKRAIQDSRTKIIYYLESDKRHIAAVSPDGKLLWCCEVKTATPGREKVCPDWHITEFRLLTPNPSDGKDEIYVTIYESGYGGGFIDLKTGRYIDSGSVL